MRSRLSNTANFVSILTQQLQGLSFRAEIKAHRHIFGDECYTDRFCRGIRLKSPFAEYKHRGNYAPYRDRHRATLPGFAYAANECRNCAGKQKQNEADS